MRLTVELEPEQLFTGGDVVEIVKVIVSKYRDEGILLDILQTVLDTIVADYKDEHEWYVQRHIESAFDDKTLHAVDPETIAEAERYSRAAEKIADMVKLLRVEGPDRVIGD